MVADDPAAYEGPPRSTPTIVTRVDPSATGSKETPSLNRRVQNNGSASGVSAQAKEEKDPFDDEALQKAWEAFRSHREKANAADTEMLVLNRKVSKEGEFHVKIHLSSALEGSILERIEQDIVQHLRKELHNTLIQLNKEVTEQVVTKKLYTSKEKYEYMVQQNPALKDMKERLGLDFDF